MSPKTITQQLSDIKSKLPLNSESPLEISTNSISDFFKIATVTVISVVDTLSFSIEIPVTNGMRFMIYEVIPKIDPRSSHYSRSGISILSSGQNTKEFYFIQKTTADKMYSFKKRFRLPKQIPHRCQ